MVKENTDLNLIGKIAVITGGTSGIGLEIARKFAGQNCKIIIVGRDDIKGKNVENKINEEFEKNCCLFLKCDVSSSSEAENICKKILSLFNRVDILVLNAAAEIVENINEIKLESWEKVFDTNVNGVFYFIRFLIDSMIKNKKGNIIIISSMAAYVGGGGGMHYAASKAALKGISARINLELLPQGIRSNIISPGFVDTPMLRKKFPDTEEINNKINSQIPIRRMAQPSDIANLALFLASDMSEYICGQDILIDGGLLFARKPVKI